MNRLLYYINMHVHILMILFAYIKLYTNNNLHKTILSIRIYIYNCKNISFIRSYVKICLRLSTHRHRPNFYSYTNEDDMEKGM